MLTRYKIALGTSVCIMLAGMALSSADGAQPRSARAVRTTARPVSTARVQAEPVPEVVEPVAEDAGVVFEEGEWIEEDGACGAVCYDPCCAPACNLFGGGFWVDMDFLLWWRDERVFPALVTTQPANGVMPGATVLFGGPVDESARPGGRLEFGLWLDPCQRTAIGARYMAVADASVSPEYTSDDLAFLARPFTDVSITPPEATADAVFNAGAQLPTTGRLGLRSDSKVQAGDVFFYWKLRQYSCANLGLLAGYQFAEIDEDLFIDTLKEIPPAPQSIAITDLFDAQNEFHGGMFGLRGDYRFGQFGVEMMGRFGFGNMRQTIRIEGSTINTAVDGSQATRNRGLLAQSLAGNSNLNGGLHEQDKFSYMNEAGVKLAFYPVERLKLSVGYSLMYWSSVVRPGQEIDTLVDGSLLTDLPQPNATHPTFEFNPTDYLVHGLNLGAEFQF